MRALLWIVVVTVVALVVVVPVVYFYTASQLPTLDSEADLERPLRLDIEGQRMTKAAVTYDKEKESHRFERPDFARLPKELVALYISQRGCPTFFQTPRESGLDWTWRLVAAVFGKELRGTGWCERLLSVRLAQRLGIKGDLQLAIAANKIHSFLSKDQLVAWDLAVVWFEDGVIGVESASLQLFKRPPEQLELSETAELALALPPNNIYGQLKACQNPLLLRQYRDALLDQLGSDALVAPSRVGEAKAKPVACTRR